MADPYGNYQANQGLLSGPDLNPKGLDPELLRQITGLLSQAGPTPGLALPAGNMGYGVLQDAATAGKYAMGNPDRLTTDQIIPSVVNAASMAMGAGMPMAEAGAVGVAGGRLPTNYRDAFNLGPRNEYLGGLPATQEAIQARAVQQGFNPDQTLYHGRYGEFEGMGFKDPTNKSEQAIFLTPDPDVANAYAGGSIAHNAEVMPLVAKYQNPKEVDLKGRDYDYVDLPSILKEAKDQGHDAVWIRNMIDVAQSEGRKLQDQLAIFDPTALRSKFAAFNPKYAGTSNLISAGGPPVGILSDRNRR